MVDESENEKTVKRSVSLPEKLYVKVRELADSQDGNASRVFAEAVREFTTRTAEDREAARKFIAAADFLHNNAEIFDERQRIIEARLASVETNLEYIAKTLEGIFHIRREPLTIDVPTQNGFDDLLSEASDRYIRNPSLLTPTLPELTDSQKAAEAEAYKNRLSEAEQLLKSMPFMEEERFYIAPTPGGVGLYDRKFKTNGEVIGPLEDSFMVLSIKNGVYIYYPEIPPHFQVDSADIRPRNHAYNLKEVAKVIPVIVADYLAFRRLEKT
ncbi:hypothetical protein QA648_17840 [Rhizobium sp. CB3171]|uniref:hypothetical protein n=1 Tax=Rhizobium sp. CB3171 TaxID=3039157 RepID=UPI0024B19838|nr:hypothetical protein [Rhizobium sp. CB3171]WFU01939.1 hypothetical protein QA648_17840 [Rhizobium sp. CB3171]